MSRRMPTGSSLARMDRGAVCHKAWRPRLRRALASGGIVARRDGRWTTTEPENERSRLRERRSDPDRGRASPASLPFLRTLRICNLAVEVPLTLIIALPAHFATVRQRPLRRGDHPAANHRHAQHRRSMLAAGDDQDRCNDLSVLTAKDRLPDSDRSRRCQVDDFRDLVYLEPSRRVPGPYVTSPQITEGWLPPDVAGVLPRGVVAVERAHAPGGHRLAR